MRAAAPQATEAQRKTLERTAGLLDQLASLRQDQELTVQQDAPPPAT
jgi:hypothetical protein